MSQDASYFEGVSSYVADGWNRFWFSPSSPIDLCGIRVLVGLLALVWQVSFSPSLTTWVGSEGWFDTGVYHSWVGDEPGATTGRFSLLFVRNATLLWGIHIASSIVLLAFTIGLATRITSVLALIVVLSYVHRAPFVTAQPEVILSFLVGYLCIAPCGVALSVDAWRRNKTPHVADSSWATIARRLMQVHLCAVYLLAFTSKLAGPTWWNGEAMWWYVAQSSVKSVDVSFLQTQPLLLNVWTFSALVCDASMIVLVWNRWLRPLALAFSTTYWLVLAIMLGRFAFPITMIVAGLVFCGPDAFHGWYNRARKRSN